MPMQMGFRWYGEGNDKISLGDIRQIPGVSTIVWEGYIRPDHGRHLWDEKPGNVRPGYGLYDRALGIMYMLGAWDLMEKEK